MKTVGILKGLVQKFETNNPAQRDMFYDLRKMFRDMLNELSVPFFDPCCPNAAGTGVSPVVQNNLAAGEGGAIPVNNYLTTINTDAGGDAFTLADGTVTGQTKKILLVVDGGGNGVVTPANLAGGATITFNDAGDYAILQFNGTEWVVIENSGTAIA